jgi:transposase-like protein
MLACDKLTTPEFGTAIISRQIKHLNHSVEQDHRAVKRVTRPMLGFKSFWAAQRTFSLAAIRNP